MHKNWTTNDLKMDVDPRMQRTRNARSTKFNDPMDRNNAFYHTIHSNNFNEWLGQLICIAEGGLSLNNCDKNLFWSRGDCMKLILYLASHVIWVAR